MPQLLIKDGFSEGNVSEISQGLLGVLMVLVAALKGEGESEDDSDERMATLTQGRVQRGAEVGSIKRRNANALIVGRTEGTEGYIRIRLVVYFTILPCTPGYDMTRTMLHGARYQSDNKVTLLIVWNLFISRSDRDLISDFIKCRPRDISEAFVFKLLA